MRTPFGTEDHRDDAPIREVARTLTTAQNAPAVLRRIADLARAAVDARSAYLERVDFQSNEVEVIATAGEATPLVGARVPYPGSLAEDVLERDTPEIVSSEELRRRPIAEKLSEECHRCTALVVPLISEGDAVGALILFRSLEGAPYTEEEVARTRLFGDLAALALRRVLLARQLEERLRALEESERRFRLLVQGVKDYAIFMLNPAGRVMSWNEGAQRSKGYAREEILGEHFSRFYTLEDRRRRHPEHELEIAAREGVYQEEGWRVRKDGSLFWAHAAITSIRDQAGELIGFANVTRDLTERKEAEEELRTREQRLASVLDVMPVGVFVADASGRITALNAAARDIWGEAAPLVSDPGRYSEYRAWDAETGHRLEAADWALTRTLETGRAAGPQELEIETFDGRRRTILNYAVPIHDENGRLTGAIATNVEITDRREAEAALRASEARFRALAENASEAIVTIDAEDRVVFANPATARVFGYELDELLRLPFTALIPERFRDRHRAGIQHYLSTQERRIPWDGIELPGLRSDGTEVPVEVTFSTYEQGGRTFFSGTMRDISDRKRAEEALRESETRFRQLTENAREVFWLFSAHSRELLYVSPAFEQVWGRSLEEIHRDPEFWVAAVHPGDRASFVAFREAIRERDASVEYRILRPDGSGRWLLTRGFPVRDADGQVIRVGGVTEDITEEKEATQRMEFLARAARVLGSSLDYEETLRNVAELAVPGVADWCVVDVLENGEIRRLSAAHSDPEKMALALEVGRRYPPSAAAPAGVARVLRTGEPELLARITDEQLRQSAQDEEHYRMLQELGLRSAMIAPMRARGRSLGAVTFITAESGRLYGPNDLRFAEELAGRASSAVDNARLYREAEEARSQAERRAREAQEARGEAERRAREEEALRRAAQAVTATFTIEEVIREIADNALVATNADGAFVKRIELDANGVEVVAVAGERVPELGTRGPYRGSYAELVTETGEAVLVPCLSEATRTLPDGIMHACGDCSAIILPLMDAGEAIGTLVLTRLPERKGFRPDETRRAHTFADLASLAFRKVNLLQESERRREELEAVMESRARLIRGFSHDVKNPLGAADGLLDLIRSGIIDDPTKRGETIERAQRAIRGALGLISDLSELARAEAGQIEIRPEPVDVRELAREMTEEHRGQANAKGLQIGCRIPDELPLVVSDASRIRQILGNLISNAVKYTATGRIEVRVDVRRRLADGAWCIAVDVEDTGSGIPEDRQHLLFHEFTRLEPKSTAGAGLGLAISQRIAEALGGRITVESEAEKGSVFTLWLPLAAAPGP